MSIPKRATRLEELAAQLIVEPLRPGDRRYVDLSAGRGSKELRRMALHLGDFSAEDNRFAHVAFTGHRGSGKSTELYRLGTILATASSPSICSPTSRCCRIATTPTSCSGWSRPWPGNCDDRHLLLIPRKIRRRRSASPGGRLSGHLESLEAG